MDDSGRQEQAVPVGLSLRAAAVAVWRGREGGRVRDEREKSERMRERKGLQRDIHVHDNP